MEMTLQQWHFAVLNCGLKPRGDFALAMRIENTILSVARHTGGIILNGDKYLYVNPYDTQAKVRVEIVVREDVIRWANAHMGADAVSNRPRPVPLAQQFELFKGSCNGRK